MRNVARSAMQSPDSGLNVRWTQFCLPPVIMLSLSGDRINQISFPGVKHLLQETVWHAFVMSRIPSLSPVFL